MPTRHVFAAQPGHVEDALQFAAKAWRRPLTPQEKDRLRRFYTQSRETQKLSHSDAIRAVIARVLVSPAFLYRLEQPAQTSKRAPLTSWELANRLSFFLWSSLPDAELRRAAEKNELVDPAQLARQTKRMLADPKAEALSTRFASQWFRLQDLDKIVPDYLLYPQDDDTLARALGTSELSDRILRAAKSAVI